VVLIVTTELSGAIVLVWKYTTPGTPQNAMAVPNIHAVRHFLFTIRETNK